MADSIDFGTLCSWDGKLWEATGYKLAEKRILLELRARPRGADEDPVPMTEARRLKLDFVREKGIPKPLVTITDVKPVAGTKRMLNVFWVQDGVTD